MGASDYQVVNPPVGVNYASPLIGFALGEQIASLPQTYFEGQQRKRVLDFQKEMQGLPLKDGQPDWSAISNLAARYAGSPQDVVGAANLYESRQNKGGLFNSLPSTIAPVGTQPATQPPTQPQNQPPRPSMSAAGPGNITPPPQRQPPQQTAMASEDQDSVRSIATETFGGRDVSEMIPRFAQALKVDPDAPLTPQQVQQVKQWMGRTKAAQDTGLLGQNMTPQGPGMSFAPPSGGGTSGAPGPVPSNAPETAAPASGIMPNGPVPQQQPQPAPAPISTAQPTATPSSNVDPILLPPGFSDPRQAVIALRQEALRLSVNPLARDKAHALSKWADDIVAAVAGPRQFTTIGHDENGLPVMGFVNPYRQTVTQPAGAPQQAPTATAGLTGEAYLSTLDPGRAAEIKAITEGRFQPPTGMALKSPQIQALMRQVAQYEPGFDMTIWKRRFDTQKDFASGGKSGQNVTAFNTAIAHLDTLDKAVDALGNRTSSLYNRATGLVQEQFDTKYQEALKSFRTAKTAVADELTRAFRGTGGNVHDLVQWEKSINEADSPEALRAAVKQAVELLRGRIEAIGDNYNRGMSVSRDPVALLTPKAQAALKRLSGETRATSDEMAAGAPSATTAAPGKPAPPKVGDVRDGYQYLGGNPGDPKSWKKVGQ